MNTKLKIIENGISMTVGHLSKNPETQEVLYHIPPFQEFDERNHVRISGLQYYGFSEFVLLLEWTNPSYGNLHFLVSQKDYKASEASMALTPLKGGKARFNQIAKQFLETDCLLV